MDCYPYRQDLFGKYWKHVHNSIVLWLHRHRICYWDWTAKTSLEASILGSGIWRKENMNCIVKLNEYLKDHTENQWCALDLVIMIDSDWTAPVQNLLFFLLQVMYVGSAENLNKPFLYHSSIKISFQTPKTTLSWPGSAAWIGFLSSNVLIYYLFFWGGGAFSSFKCFTF